MKVKVLYGVIFILLSFQLSNAQTISMKEFLESVEQSHPFFEKESLSTAIKIKEQERFLGAQDWAISASSYYTYQKPVSSGLGMPEEISMVAGDIALEKALRKYDY